MILLYIEDTNHYNLITRVNDFYNPDKSKQRQKISISHKTLREYSMGPPRFELGLPAPQAGRMPSYPTGPEMGL